MSNIKSLAVMAAAAAIFGQSLGHLMEDPELLPKQVGQNTVPVVSAFNPSANNNMALYWGQGPYQKDLIHHCKNSKADIIPIGFVNRFPDQTGGYPGTNFGNQCGDQVYENQDKTKPGQLLSNCPQIGKDIKECQKLGKKILLSLGGAAPTDQYLVSADSAVAFADMLWDIFGPVHRSLDSNSPRPFGDASVDGFDLDIESEFPNDQSSRLDQHYDVLVDTLRGHFKSDLTKPYYISGSPQCVVPDAHLADAIKKVQFDFLFVQFYNTPQCSARSFFNTRGITFDQWAEFVRASGSRAKLFLGLPGSTAAVEDDSMYLEPSEAESLLEYFQCRHQDIFGGLMIYDATASENNLVNDMPYADYLKSRLDESACTKEPPIEPHNLPSIIPAGTGAPIRTGSGFYPTDVGKYPTGASFVSHRPTGLPLPPSGSVSGYFTSASGTRLPIRPSGSIRSYPLSSGGMNVPYRPSDSSRSYPQSVGGTGLPIRPSGSVRIYPHSTGGTGLPVHPSGSVRSYPQSTWGTGLPVHPSGSVRSYPHSTGETQPFPAPTSGFLPSSNLPNHPSGSVISNPSIRPTHSANATSTFRSVGLAPHSTGLHIAPSDSGINKPSKSANATLTFRSSGSAHFSTKLNVIPSGSDIPNSSAKPVHPTNATSTPHVQTLSLTRAGATDSHPLSSGTAPFTLHSASGLVSNRTSMPSPHGSALVSGGHTPLGTNGVTRVSPTTVDSGIRVLPSHGSLPAHSGSAEPSSTLSDAFTGISAESSFHVNPTSFKAPFPITNSTVSASTFEHALSTGAPVNHETPASTQGHTNEQASSVDVPSNHETPLPNENDSVAIKHASQTNAPANHQTPGASGTTANEHASSVNALHHPEATDTGHESLVNAPHHPEATATGHESLVNAPHLPEATVTEHESLADVYHHPEATVIAHASTTDVLASHKIHTGSPAAGSESPGSITSKPDHLSSMTIVASVQDIVTTEIVTSYATTHPATHTVTSGGSTFLQHTSAVSTVYSTVISTICTKCVAPPTAAPSASTQEVVTTVIAYTTVTTCPVTNTITSGGSRVLQITSTLSTITESVTSTICTKCVPPSTNAPAPGAPGSQAPEQTQSATPINSGSQDKSSSDSLSPSSPTLENASPASQKQSHAGSPHGSSPGNGNQSPSHGQQSVGSAPSTEQRPAQGEHAPGNISPPANKEQNPAQGEHAPGSDSPSANTKQNPAQGEHAPSSNGPASGSIDSPASGQQAPASNGQAPANNGQVPSTNGDAAAVGSNQPKIMTVSQTVVPVPLHASQTENSLAAATSSLAVAPFLANNGTTTGPTATGTTAPRVSAPASTSPLPFTGAANKVGSGFGLVAGLAVAVVMML
ncbi:MAG: hypothetical protein Q9164_000197 [Protoblastenia rupestris]